MEGLRCYHHINCEDRPAVAHCTKCGKALCKECADNLRSKETGKIVCVDCLNEELESDRQLELDSRSKLKRKTIIIIIVWLLGIPLSIILSLICSIPPSFFIAIFGGDPDSVLIAFILWCCLLSPSRFAMFGVHISIAKETDVLIFEILLFPILQLIAPITLIIWFVYAIRKMRLARRFAELLMTKQLANQQYAECASKMKTVLPIAEYELKLKEKYAGIAQEQAAKAISEALETYKKEYNELISENEALQRQLKEKAEQRNKAMKEMDEIREEIASINFSLKRAKANRRSTDEVDSGKKAA